MKKQPHNPRPLSEGVDKGSTEEANDSILESISQESTVKKEVETPLKDAKLTSVKKIIY